MIKLISILSLFILLISCRKEPIIEQKEDLIFKGIFCLNEGLFQQNNASLSIYNRDSLKIKNNQFSTVNGRGLGDTANDMIYFEHNNKPYYALAIDVSSQIEILNANDLKSVKQIGVFNNSIARSPRRLFYYQNFLYSINFDGTLSVISIPEFNIIKTISVGLNPEFGTVIGNNLFCVNTGGLNYPLYDNTISVVNLSSNSLIHTFESGLNCGVIIKDKQEEIYVISRGNYSTINSKLLRIDPFTYNVVDSFNINITAMAIHNELIYYYDASTQSINTFNTESETISNLDLINCDHFNDFYKIFINENTDEIFLIDANGYVSSSTIHVYSIEGKFKFKFNAGLNTGKLLFKE